MPLRDAVIRLARENPTMRPHLLPLVSKQAWGPDLTVAEVKDVFVDSHLTVARALHEAQQAMVRAANACKQNPIAEAKALPTVEKILRGIRDATEEVNLFGHYAAHLPSYERLASEEQE